MSKLTIKGDTQAYSEILTPAALAFVEKLVEKFGARRDTLLSARKEAQERINGGELPYFSPETADIRNGDWQVADAPAGLADRRVEITAPAELKKAILALNSSAKVYMADFEDSLAPTWENSVGGQLAMKKIASGTAEMENKETGKKYQLNPEHSCLLFVRPRGWHLPEKQVLYDGAPISGALFDFGLFFFHNAVTLAKNNKGPFFYLPKVEHWREAELWNEVMEFAENEMGLAVGTAKATLLIETLPAVFQMHEILHAMKNRLIGLNCGRWDYIFSYIKTLAMHGDCVLPERKILTMDRPLLRAYSLELIKTCHHRNAHAMGGMAAFIPIKNDATANDAALEKVRADKRREANDGHDGTWVAHPDLISVAAQVFDEYMPAINQKNIIPNVQHEAAHFLAVPSGDVSSAGFDNNIQVAVRYLAAWLGGAGAVPIYNMMEDAATAEISRCQLWQWLRYPTCLSDGGEITAAHFNTRLAAISTEIQKETEQSPQVLQAVDLLSEMVHAPTLDDFLTLKAYPFI